MVKHVTRVTPTSVVRDAHQKIHTSYSTRDMSRGVDIPHGTELAPSEARVYVRVRAGALDVNFVLKLGKTLAE